ncbi:unnamed protein product [Rotaria socialis]
MDYQKALSFQKCALSILSQLVPKNDARLVMTYINVGCDYTQWSNDQLAIIYFQKTLIIIRDISTREYSNENVNPIISIFVFRFCFLVDRYIYDGNVSKALHYMNMAVQLYKSSLLRYRQKDFDFPEEPIHQIVKLLATVAANTIRNDSKGALASSHSLLKLNVELNSTMVDLNLLATVSHRIASVYDLANKYEEAYSFAEAELRIRCNDSNPNFEIVASTPEWFARLYPNESTMQIL